MKKSTLFLLIALVLIVAACLYEFVFSDLGGNEPWNAEYKMNEYNIIYKKLNNFNGTDSIKAAVSGCALVKLENTYPKGLNDVSKDSLGVIIANFAVACEGELKPSDKK